MDDLISRAKVVKAIDRHTFDTDNGLCLDEDITVILEEVPSEQSDVTDINVGNTIYRQAVIDTVHKSIFDFFDICDDDEESPMTYKDEQLLKLNKAITTRIKALPSAQPLDVRLAYYRGVNDGIEQCTEKIRSLISREEN